MASLPWHQHFFASTRGRIVLLLRRASATVDELARALHLTDNAVRAHLATLERDGLVCQAGVRRGSSKPAQIYDLTPEAEQIFPKAYGPVLRSLLDALAVSLSPTQLIEVIQCAGQRLAAQWSIPSEELRARLRSTIDIFNQLGGLTDVEEFPESVVIRSATCPLAAIAPDHPEVCRLTQAFLSSIIGLSVEEHCARDPAATCFFILRKESRSHPAPPG
ncbi:MAG TPA: ArsR family transcriptional regulator [Ktedonobacteraceae bacterium]|jgi:predicted ArsR family transcriptional regulator